MKMSDEDRVNPAPLHARPHELKLRAFAAVEQEDVAIPDQGCRGQAPGERGYSRTGSEKNYSHGLFEHRLEDVTCQPRVFPQAAHGISVPVAAKWNVDAE